MPTELSDDACGLLRRIHQLIRMYPDPVRDWEARAARELSPDTHWRRKRAEVLRHWLQERGQSSLRHCSMTLHPPNQVRRKGRRAELDAWRKEFAELSVGRHWRGHDPLLAVQLMWFESAARDALLTPPLAIALPSEREAWDAVLYLWWLFKPDAQVTDARLAPIASWDRRRLLLRGKGASDEVVAVRIDKMFQRGKRAVELLESDLTTERTSSEPLDGPTQKELVRSTEDKSTKKAAISETIFRELVRDSGIRASRSGEKGRQFTRSEVRALIDTAQRTGKQDRARIAERWAKYADS